MIRKAARAVLSVGVIIGWFIALTWLALTVSQIAVGRVNLPSCASSHPLTAGITGPELHRVLSQEMTRC
jgi:hypothetical protein